MFSGRWSSVLTNTYRTALNQRRHLSPVDSLIQVRHFLYALEGVRRSARFLTFTNEWLRAPTLVILLANQLKNC